jgi:hypothetical protein
MLATGRTLEGYAERRAARDLHALLEHAPRSARRRSAQGGLEVVELDAIQPDDRLLVGPGEVVAVDGSVEDPQPTSGGQGYAPWTPALREARPAARRWRTKGHQTAPPGVQVVRPVGRTTWDRTWRLAERSQQRR